MMFVPLVFLESKNLKKNQKDSFKNLMDFGSHITKLVSIDG